MVAGEHQHRHPRGLRLPASLQRGQLDGQGFQAAQRALRFGQLPLADDGLLPVRLRRRRASPSEPWICHVCSVTALQSRIVGRAPLPRCAAQGRRSGDAGPPSRAQGGDAGNGIECAHFQVTGWTRSGRLKREAGAAHARDAPGSASPALPPQR